MLNAIIENYEEKINSSIIELVIEELMQMEGGLELHQFVNNYSRYSSYTHTNTNCKYAQYRTNYIHLVSPDALGVQVFTENSTYDRTIEFTIPRGLKVSATDWKGNLYVGAKEVYRNLSRYE